MSEQRLDELVSALAAARPVLDDVARARVGAVLQAACRRETGGETGGGADADADADREADAALARATRRRWAIATAVAATVLVVVAFALRGGDRHRRVVVDAIPPANIGELPDGALLSAPRGATVHGQIHGASLTLYGPGWAARRADKIVVDADAFVVDRSAGSPGNAAGSSAGDAPIELQLRVATIRVRYATFSVYDSRGLQVTVLRGEIFLACAGAARDRKVSAGASAACGSVKTAAASPSAGAGGDAATDALGSAAIPPVVTAAPPPESTTVMPAAAATQPDSAVSARPPPAPSASATTSMATRRPASRPAAGIADRAGDRGAVSVDGVAAFPFAAPDAAGSASPPVAPVPAPPADSRIAVAPAAPETAATAAPPVVTATTAGRYAAAEQLIAKDPRAARAALLALVTDAPDAPETAPALLDLARLSAAAGNEVAAKAALALLSAHPGAAALAMPAAYLRCTLESTGDSYRACLAAFRTAFPDSPRDAEVLAALAIATARGGDCAAARPLLADSMHRYPDGPRAADVRAWQAHCEAGK